MKRVAPILVGLFVLAGVKKRAMMAGGHHGSHDERRQRCNRVPGAIAVPEKGASGDERDRRRRAHTDDTEASAEVVSAEKGQDRRHATVGVGLVRRERQLGEDRVDVFLDCRL